LRFLFLEPFFGGSHKDFAEGLCAHSRHKIDLLTLPARFWKWRMRGAALHFAEGTPSLDEYDGLITTDLMSLSDFKSLKGRDCPPVLVYFHENQLTYPLAPGENMDFQFGFTDITTALAADRVIFNSRTHYEAFFSSLPEFLGMMPEYRPRWVVDRIRAKADVIHPGCRFPAHMDVPSMPDSPPVIVWNHRWEFDKEPELFFEALDEASKRGMDFRLALLGENFQLVPKPFAAARERYGERVVQYGYIESRKEYHDWLRRGSIVISTAKQENFGISVVEAVRHGCIPLLPDRLSYPEIIPRAFHEHVLYKDLPELIEKLCHMIANQGEFQRMRRDLSLSMGPYAWETCIDKYDGELVQLAGFRRNEREKGNKGFTGGPKESREYVKGPVRCSVCQRESPEHLLIEVDGKPVCTGCLYGDSEPLCFHPIGIVVNDKSRKEGAMGTTGGDTSEIHLFPGMERFMKGVDEETHLTVLWHAHLGRPLKTEFSRGYDGKRVGPFAARTPDRPTPIGVSDVELLEVRGTVLRVRGLDAVNGTPVLDIKVAQESLKRGRISMS
jgi:tRNA (Thr-GGU) A37 N-methylase/glycosyltransferase involved in cell wall biosynthesis